LKIELREKVGDRLADIDKILHHVDENHDGVLSPVEFEAMFTVLDIDFSKDNLRRLMRATDTNKDGRVDF
jgi:Ca2+-binding EF-hand superfamily protein